MISIDKLNEQIAELETKRDGVTGRPCEVYSRIVGYYRPVQHWNKGKKQELAERKLYEVNDVTDRL